MHTKPLTVAAAQISSTADPVENLSAMQAAVAHLGSRVPDLVAFPEGAMACFGTTLADVAEPLDGPFANGVRKLAADAQTTIVVGMFTPSGDGRVHNTLLAVGPHGETTYNKIHLYDAFGARESDTVAAGSEVVTFDAFDTTIGLATCYDLRFADQFTALRKAGATVIVVPASWGEGPGKAEQWDVLTRARALDAQAWLLACDQAWTAPRGADALGVGNSVLVDPVGRVRARLGHEIGTLLGEVDLDLPGQIRERIPLG